MLLLMALSSENWGGADLGLGDEEEELGAGGGAEADEDEAVASMIGDWQRLASSATPVCIERIE